MKEEDEDEKDTKTNKQAKEDKNWGKKLLKLIVLKLNYIFDSKLVLCFKGVLSFQT